MNDLMQILTAPVNILWTSAASAFIATVVSYIFKRRENRHKARLDYEYEQRKKLREVIGRYHGRLLSAADSLNHRLLNLYDHHDRGWLSVGGEYHRSGYYFLSTIYRFLNVFALVRQLETEAILLDARIAEKKDFIFLNYAAALHWVMTDVALFDGLAYNNTDQTDHFFSDDFRNRSEMCIRNDKFLIFEEFKNGPCFSAELAPILAFFDDLRPDENRLRWDRIVALHLVLLAFINAFGYKRQYSLQESFSKAAKKVQNRKVLENLVGWLPRHDLNKEREARKISTALREFV